MRKSLVKCKFKYIWKIGYVFIYVCCSLETIIIKRGRRHLGYGFITFEKEEEAKRAAKDLNKKELDGREINVEVARPKSELPTKRTPKVSSSRRKRRVKKVNKVINRKLLILK